MTRIEKFTRGAKFFGRGFEWVDPQKEVAAAVQALNNGFLSFSDIQQRYGRDAEEVFAQLQSDLQTADKYGIKIAIEPLGGTIANEYFMAQNPPPDNAQTPGTDN